MFKEIILSEGAGFCMGVKKAFYNTIEYSKDHKKSCLYGSIVHNKFAVAELEKAGIRTENSLETILSDREIESVVIRAHGIPPEMEKRLEESGKELYDLTCPIVKKVQLLAGSLSSEGESIIIYGKQGHPEVVGIEGYCRGSVHVVSTIEDALAIPSAELKSPVLISQTTMNSSTFERLAEELKAKIPELKIENTLCRSPIYMQEKAEELAKRVDLMVIVGDRSSSNTKTLYEKVKTHSKALFAESPEDIDPLLVSSASLIGIAGGASTPSFQLESIAAFLKSIA